MGEETTLADLLDLNLHNYEDDVHNIVDKAIKVRRVIKGAGMLCYSLQFEITIYFKAKK